MAHSLHEGGTSLAGIAGALGVAESAVADLFEREERMLSHPALNHALMHWMKIGLGAVRVCCVGVFGFRCSCIAACLGVSVRSGARPHAADLDLARRILANGQDKLSTPAPDALSRTLCTTPYTLHPNPIPEPLPTRAGLQCLVRVLVSAAVQVSYRVMGEERVEEEGQLGRK